MIEAAPPATNTASSPVRTRPGVFRRLVGAVGRSSATPVAIMGLLGVGIWRWESSLPIKAPTARVIAPRREVRPLVVRGLNARLSVVAPASTPELRPSVQLPTALSTVNAPAPIQLFDAKGKSPESQPPARPVEPGAGVVQCVVERPVDNGGLVATVEGSTIGDITAEGGGKVLIGSGSRVVGSLRFDASKGRAFGEGTWNFYSKDLELVFEGAAVEPGDPLPKAGVGRGLDANPLTAKADKAARADRAAQVVATALPFPPPGQRAGDPKAVAVEEARIDATISHDGSYLLLPRGKHFLLYLVRTLDVHTRDGSDGATAVRAALPTATQGGDDPLPER